MPIYEYECPKCGVVEAQQRISEPALTICPTRGCRRKVTKLISSTSFQLKGSGWYQTDYGGKAPAKGATDGKADSEKPKTDTSSSKSDSSAASAA